MQGAGQRQPEQGRRDYPAESRDLMDSVMRDWTAAGAALRRMPPGPVTDRASAEVAILGIRLAESRAAIQALSAAIFCREQLDKQDRRAEAAETARSTVREIPRHRVPPAVRGVTSRPLRSVPVVALVMAAGGAVWQVMRAHAARTVSAGMVAAAAAGTMTSLVVLTPQTSPAATVPHKPVLIPVAASPAAAIGAAAVRRRQHHPHSHPLPAVPVSVTASASPSPSLSASQSPSAAPSPGTLLVAPVMLRAGQGGTAILNVSAVDGPVWWSARSSTPAITLERSSGYLAAGESVTVLVRAAGPGTVTIRAEGQADVVVQVSP